LVVRVSGGPLIAYSIGRLFEAAVVVSPTSDRQRAARPRRTIRLMRLRGMECRSRYTEAFSRFKAAITLT
jgi:hypothetical protein